MGEASRTFPGSGEQTRDFVYIGDAVKALIHAGISYGIKGEVFNVGYGKSITINHLWNTIKKVIGAGVNPRYLDGRPGEIRHSCASVAKLNEYKFDLDGIKYNHQGVIENGLLNTAGWYRKIREAA